MTLGWIAVNRLVSTLPPGMAQASKLTILEVSNNRLTGPHLLLPHWGTLGQKPHWSLTQHIINEDELAHSLCFLQAPFHPLCLPALDSCRRSVWCVLRARACQCWSCRIRYSELDVRW